MRAISFVLNANNGAEKFTCIYRMKVLGVPSEISEGKTERVLRTLYSKRVERLHSDHTSVLEQRRQQMLQKTNEFLSDEYTKYATNSYFLRL